MKKTNCFLMIYLCAKHQLVKPYKTDRSGRPLKIVFLSIFIIGIAIFVGCENPITGMGPQPSYIDKHEHTSMLNVFGILRPDSQNGKPLSFVHLEESYPFNTYPDSTLITDASVILFEYNENTIVDSLQLNYTNFNQIFPTSEYRHPDFLPEERHTYGIACTRDGFPELTSITTLPSVPGIVNNSIHIKPNKLTFFILRDSLAALYDIYLLIGQKMYSERIRRPETGNVQVTMTFDEINPTEGLLIINAYDLQLSEYITYNVSIKPNTYRSNYSTVNNGYGCFGSLNILTKAIVF